ncbi:MAG: acylneuraminate cytidylyltransferase family protein [Oceanospirillaceae bacterium]|nr:acylneuraminate cytidylyltransferase family protein [Oceanospirillaceae bacterium]
MKRIAFIFARGGSKGLPGKNLKPLMGKPLIEYAVECALKSDFIHEVYVSTEDDDIRRIALKLGVKVIDRPMYLASDTSAEWLSWQHAIKWVFNLGNKFDEFVSLPVTSPLRSVEDVNDAIKMRETSNADICIAITPASRSPYFNMVKKIEGNYVELVNPPRSDVHRRQDAPCIYDITTSVYVSTPNYILNSMGLFDGKVASIEVPKERAIDIDDIYDFMLAQYILEESYAKK